MIVRYVRTYALPGSHFNSEQAYHVAWDLHHKTREMPDAATILAAMRETHGHNFNIEIALLGRVSVHGWLVDDVKLARVVNEWHNINLSIHRDFITGRERATTELMALKLLAKLQQVFTLGPNDHIEFEYVRVHETPEIYAEARP